MLDNRVSSAGITPLATTPAQVDGRVMAIQPLCLDGPDRARSWAERSWIRSLRRLSQEPAPGWQREQRAILLKDLAMSQGGFADLYNHPLPVVSQGHDKHDWPATREPVGGSGK